MAGWQGSNRRARLPSNWSVLREQVKERDEYRCVVVEYGFRCQHPGMDVDHIVPGDDHSLGNLQLLCAMHHKEKTGQEAAAARAIARANRPGRKRGKGKHPGLK